MQCNCSNNFFHDFDCNLTPKCIHCNTRLDYFPIHSYNCPTHTRCIFCGIAETLERNIHIIDCPKWTSEENQSRIENLNRLIHRNEIRSLIPRQSISTINLSHLIFDSSEECPICREKKSNIKTKCGHYFHQKCLESWCNISRTCPMCRNPNFS